jgi:hypothetical protein
MITKMIFSLAVSVTLALTSQAALAAANGTTNGDNSGKPFQELNQLISENRALIEANSADISALKADVAGINARIGFVESSLASVAAQVDANTSAIGDAFQRIAMAQGDVQALRDELMLLAQQHNADMSEMRQRLDGVDAELLHLAAASAALAANLDARVAELRAQINNNAVGIDALLADVVLLNANLTSINANYNLLASQQAGLQLQMAGYQQQLDNLGAALNALKSRVDTYHNVDPCLDTVSLGQVTAGELVNDGVCMSANRGSAAARYYTFTLVSPTTVTIDMEGAPSSAGTLSDPYLYLHSGDRGGAIVVADDDSGTGYNARIVRSLSAGTYTIEATSYSVQYGTFRLTVR